MRLPLWRRLTLALVTLLLAGALFHGQLAQALIGRGDDALRYGDRSAAVRYYQRALAVDARSIAAADRLAFYLDMRRRPGDAQAAIAVADSALAHAANDATLLADRALAEELLRRWRPAERDFARAGAAGHDARYDHLAGRAALARGDAAQASRYFRLALVDDPRFSPARAALARLR